MIITKATARITAQSLAAVLLAAAASSPMAGELTTGPANAPLWQAGVDGVEIDWTPEGDFDRIYATFYQTVSVPDRRGISQAQVIAEEKAKAAIVRFLDQSSSTNRLVVEVAKDTEDATNSVTTKEGGGGISKEVKRSLLASLTEVTHSYAEGRLRGVIALEKGYDAQKQEAWVKVGMSRRTMNAATSVQKALAAPTAMADSTDASPATPTASIEFHQPSEVRQSRQTGW